MQGSDVEAKNGVNVGSGERPAAALRAGRFPPVEGQCGSCVSAVQGSDVECKAAMLRQKGNMKCRQRERLQRRGFMSLWTGSVKGLHDIRTLCAWWKRWR